MAFDARQLRVSPSQMIQPKREFINTNQEYGNRYNTHMDSSVPRRQEIVPPFQQSALHDHISATTLMNSASDITCNNFHASRKRLRDSYTDMSASSAFLQGNKFSTNMPQYYLNEDIIHQIQIQQSEIDQLIAQHAERVRLELDERIEKQSRMLVSYINEAVMKKLKEKDVQIAKMRKLNWVLEERVKSSSIENQLWRDLAQTNEATANSLRTNLEQALTQVGQEDNNNNGGGAVAEDVESCCGNNGYISKLGGGEHKRMMCRRCGMEESRVLLLPCRHLCLCALCASSVYTCPICNSIMDGSLHVNPPHQILHL